MSDATSTAMIDTVAPSSSVIVAAGAAPIVASTIDASAASSPSAPSSSSSSSSSVPAVVASSAASSDNASTRRKFDQIDNNKNNNKKGATIGGGGGGGGKRQKGGGNWKHDAPVAAAASTATDADELSSSSASSSISNGAGGLVGRKRKVALSIMYRGSAYCGLQIQNVSLKSCGNTELTVERAMMDAIYAAGGISKDNMNDTGKIKWMRAARTDKGVHAAGNILSLMMVVDGAPPAECNSQDPDVIVRINANLPADIRAIACTRVVGGFHAKYDCTSRVYEYILPSFVFDESPEILQAMHQDQTNDWYGDESANSKIDQSSSSSSSSSSAAFLYHPSLLSYRLTPAKTASIRSLLGQFKGTLNYQNFTRKKGGFMRDAAKVKKPRPVYLRDADGKPIREAKVEAGVDVGEKVVDGEKKDEEMTDAAADATAATVEVEKDDERKPKKSKDDESDDDRDGMDDDQEEAMERQMFAAQQQARSAASSAAESTAVEPSSSSSSSSAAPPTTSSSSSSSASNPFISFRPSITSASGARFHASLHTNLKNLNSGRPGTNPSQTNKTSGQYARFIRYIMDMDIEAVYVQKLESETKEKEEKEAMSDTITVNSSAASSSSSSAPSSSSSSSSSAGIEFVRVRIHGQSFMLNQIRKMVGLVVMIARGQLPLSYLTMKALKYDDYAVPTAPSLGLLLQRPSYDAYDAKIAKVENGGKGGAGAGKGKGAGGKDKPVNFAIPERDSINAVFLGDEHKQRIDAFRAEWIYGTISREEIKSGSAVKWAGRLWNNPAAILNRQEELAEEEERKEKKRKEDEKEEEEREKRQAEAEKESEIAADQATVQQ